MSPGSVFEEIDCRYPVVVLGGIATLAAGVVAGAATVPLWLPVTRAADLRAKSSCEYVTLFNANDPRFIKFYHDDVVFELNNATVIKGPQADPRVLRAGEGAHPREGGGGGVRVRCDGHRRGAADGVPGLQGLGERLLPAAAEGGRGDAHYQLRVLRSERPEVPAHPGGALQADTRLADGAGPDLAAMSAARLAGLLYLLTLPTAGFGIMSARSLLEGGVADIEASRVLVELGVLLGAAGAVIWLVAGVVFHELFRSVSDRASKLLVVFVVASVVLQLAALAGRLDAISLLDDARTLPGSSPAQTQALVVLSWHRSENLLNASIIFWGLWLVPLAWLVFRCGFLPRTLAVLLLFGAVYYVTYFVGIVLNPAYEETLVGKVMGYAFLTPGTVGEMGTALWLLIRGTGRAAGARTPRGAS